MSLQLMKERVRHSGSTAREEMIIDVQNLLKEELEHDSSYSPTIYIGIISNYVSGLCLEAKLS